MNAMAEPIILITRGWCRLSSSPAAATVHGWFLSTAGLLAVLVDAVHIFQTRFGASQPIRRREFNEAREWLLGPSGDGPFTFENVCLLLDVDQIAPADLADAMAADASGWAAMPGTAATLTGSSHAFYEAQHAPPGP